MILKWSISSADDKISVYYGLQDDFSVWPPNFCFVMAITKIKLSSLKNKCNDNYQMN